MHRRVTLEDAYGDQHYGVEHLPTQSDLPATITVNGTRWFTPVWFREGWQVVASGEWEE